MNKIRGSKTIAGGRAVAILGVGAPIAAIATAAEGSSPATSQPGSLEGVLRAGSEPKASTLASLRSFAELNEIGAQIDRAREVAAPAGADAATPWLVIPLADGGACLQVGTITGCGSSEAVAAGQPVLTTYTASPSAKGSDNPRADLVGGKGTAYGIAPEGTASISVTTPDNETTSTVVGDARVFQVDLGTTGTTPSTVTYRAVGGQPTEAAAVCSPTSR